MSGRRGNLTLYLLGVCLVAACGQPTPTPASQTDAPSPAQWIGRWHGPEGTYLEIAKNADQYQITISNLDGPRSFRAVADGRRLVFERDGVRESINVGTGTETGMKWLFDKNNCLIVKTGEGYCQG